MKKYLILLLLLIPSLSWGVCTYTAGNIVCQIDAYTDDASAAESGVETNTSTHYTPYSSETSRVAFYRWQVNVPIGATDVTAKITLKAKANGSGTATAAIDLLDQDNCANFVSNPYSLSVVGSPATADVSITSAWTTDTSYDLTGLGALVSSWIGRAGYKYGSYIGIRIRSASGNTGIRQSYGIINGGSTSNGAILTITYSGGEPTLDVRMAPPYVYTTQYLYANINNHATGDKLKITLTDKDSNVTSIANQTITSDGDNIVTVDWKAVTAAASPYKLRFVLTNSANVEYAATVYTYDQPDGIVSGEDGTFTKLHDGYPTVGINKDGALYVKATSELFFPITDYQVDFTKLAGSGKLPVVDVTNISHFLGYHGTPSDKSLLGWKAFLDVWDANNRKHIGPGVWSLDGFSGRTSDLNKLAYNHSNCESPASADDCSYIYYTKDHPALYLWTFDDEPNLGASTTYVNAATLKSWQDAIRTVDTNHPTMVTFTGIVNEFIESGDSKLDRTKTYSYLYGNKIHVMDVWEFDYYPYNFSTHSAAPSLIKLADSVDAALTMNLGLYPVWVMGESNDLSDYFGGVTRLWVPATIYPQNYQVVDGGRLYRQTAASCTSHATTEPTWPSTIGDTVASDGTCAWIDEGTYANKVLNINGATWSETPFTIGERVCASAADGGCAVASGFIGRPRDSDGTFAQTAISYIRKPADFNNYPINQIVFSSVDGTFAAGMDILGQTSGATATVDATTVYSRELPMGTEVGVDYFPPPTPDQINQWVWLSIIHGAKGIGYFCKFVPITIAEASQLLSIKTTIEALKDIILAPVSSKITPSQYLQYASATVDSGHRVDYTVRESGGQTYVIAARVLAKTGEATNWPDPANSTAISAVIPVTGLAEGTTITVRGEGRTLEAGDGTITDNFTEYAVHIYETTDAPPVEKSLQIVAPNATATSSPSGIDCGSVCSYGFESGTEVTVTGVCNTGYYGVTYSGCTGSTGVCTMSEHKVLTITCTNGRTATIGTGGTMTVGSVSPVLPGTMGTDNTDGTLTAMVANRADCWSVQAPVSGTLTTAYVKHGDTSEATSKVCVYVNDGDAPDAGDTIIGCSGAVTSSAVEWAAASMDGGSVTQGQNYYMCLFVDDASANAFNVDKSAANTTIYYKSSSGLYDTPGTSLYTGTGWTSYTSPQRSVYVSITP